MPRLIGTETTWVRVTLRLTGRKITRENPGAESSKNRPKFASICNYVTTLLKEPNIKEYQGLAFASKWSWIKPIHLHESPTVQKYPLLLWLDAMAHACLGSMWCTKNCLMYVCVLCPWRHMWLIASPASRGQKCGWPMPSGPNEPLWRMNGTETSRRKVGGSHHTWYG